MKIDILKERLNSLKNQVDDLSKADNDLFDNPEKEDEEEDNDEDKDDLAARFLRGEDVSKETKASPVADAAKRTFDLKGNPDDLSLMQKIAHHWVKQSEDRRLMRADGLVNPVLAAEGHRVSAANKVGEPFSKDLIEHMNSGEFEGMDHLDQLQSLHDFEKDWHDKNPDYLKDSLDSLSGAHGKSGDIKDAYTSEQEAKNAHMMLGGAASGGVEGGATADQASSYAEAIQQAGGNIDNETGAASASVDTDAMTSFANAHQGYLANEREQYSDEELREKASSVNIAPELGEENAYDHPLLNEHRGTINDFFSQHNKTIGGTIQAIIKKAKAAGLPESMLDAGDLREIGMHGLMQAVSTYDPSANDVKFETYASNKMSGMMQTHLNNKNPVPRATRAKAANFGTSQKIAEDQPDLAPEAPEAPEAPKPDMASQLGDERHGRLKEYEAAKAMRKPKTEE